MQALLLPLRLLAEGDRWANGIYRAAMTKILTAVFLYLGVLWIGAGFDLRWLIVGAMWMMSTFVIVTYLQPNVLGLLGLGEWIRTGDDPRKASVIRAGLLLFISVVVAGGTALILGFIGEGLFFPFAVLVILLIVACAVTIGGTHLEIWLPRISWVAVAMLVLAVVLAKWGTPAHFARISIDVRKYEVRSAEVTRAENAEISRENKNEEDDDYAKSVRMLLLCKVPSGAQEKFDKVQKEIYAEKCGQGRRRMQDSDVEKGWSYLLPKHAEEVHSGAREGAAHGGKASDGLGGWIGHQWGRYYALKDTDPLLFWSTLLIGHVLFFWLVWPPLKRFWKWLRSDSAATTTTTTSSTSSTTKKDEKKSYATGWTMLWVAIAALLVVYFAIWPNIKADATVQNIAWSIQGKPVASSSVHAVPAGTEWGAQFTSWNPHFASTCGNAKMPQGAKGKMLRLGRVAGDTVVLMGTSERTGDLKVVIPPLRGNNQLEIAKEVSEYADNTACDITIYNGKCTAQECQALWTTQNSAITGAAIPSKVWYAWEQNHTAIFKLYVKRNGVEVEIASGNMAPCSRDSRPCW